MKTRPYHILPGDVNTVVITLTQGKVALIDTIDAVEIGKYNWCAAKGKNGNYYAMRVANSFGYGRGTVIKMHREILKANSWEIVDHKDCDGLNNRRSNLRLATDSQNSQNRRDAYIGLSSKYRGVSKRPTDGKFIAKIQHESKQTYLGTFDHEEDAAKVYDVKALELFGEFARLNLN